MMRAVIAALVWLVLAVNAQFALELGKPGLRLQMFGKDLIRVGDKRKHSKRRKGHHKKNRSRKNKGKAVPKPKKQKNDKGENATDEKIPEVPLEKEEEALEFKGLIFEETKQPIDLNEESVHETSEGENIEELENEEQVEIEAEIEAERQQIEEIIREMDEMEAKIEELENHKEQSENEQTIEGGIEGQPMINLETS